MVCLGMCPRRRLPAPRAPPLVVALGALPASVRAPHPLALLARGWGPRRWVLACAPPPSLPPPLPPTGWHGSSGGGALDAGAPWVVVGLRCGGGARLVSPPGSALGGAPCARCHRGDQARQGWQVAWRLAVFGSRFGCQIGPWHCGLACYPAPPAWPGPLGAPMPKAIGLGRGAFGATCPPLPQHEAFGAGGARCGLAKLLHAFGHCPSLPFACPRLAAGALCGGAIDLLDCARPIAPPKPGGIRPLGMGWALRRVVPTCVGRQVVQGLAVALHSTHCWCCLACGGGQQGGSLATIPFALAPHPALLQALATPPGCGPSAFAGGGKATGPPGPAPQCW